MFKNRLTDPGVLSAVRFEVVFIGSTEITYRCSSRTATPNIQSLPEEILLIGMGMNQKRMLKRRMKKPREENQQIIMAKAPHKIFKRIEVPAVS